MLWMVAPTKDFHSFVFKILAFNRITLSMTFVMACDLYRRCKNVVYDSHGLPVGNHVITCEPKLPDSVFILFIEVVEQNCHNSYTYDGVQDLRLLLMLFL